MRRIIVVGILGLSGCGGAGSSLDSGAGNVGSSNQPSRNMVATISNANALMIGNGLGDSDANLSIHSSSFTALLSAASEKKLYQVKEDKSVEKVEFKNKETDEEIDIQVSKNRRAGKEWVVVEATEENEDKTLLVNTTDGTVVDVSSFDADYAQVKNDTAYMYEKGDAEIVYAIDLAAETKENGDLADSAVVAVNTRANPISQGDTVSAAHANDHGVSNGQAFAIDENANVIVPVGTDGDLEVFKPLVTTPIDLNDSAFAVNCGMNCNRHTFYSKTGVLHVLEVSHDNSPDHHITAVLSQVKMDGNAIVKTELDNQTEHFDNATNVSPMCVKVQYSINDSRRHILFDPGFFETSEDNSGTVSLNWTTRSWADFADFITYDNAIGYFFNPICEEGAMAVISGEYVYWRTFNILGSAPWYEATSKIVRLKFDAISEPEVMVEDNSLASFQVAGETVVFKTDAGSFAQSELDGTAQLADADIQPEQVVEIAEAE